MGAAGKEGNGVLVLRGNEGDGKFEYQREHFLSFSFPQSLSSQRQNEAHDGMGEGSQGGSIVRDVNYK